MKRSPLLTSLEYGGHEFLVEYTYSPGTPDVMYLPNGDPGYPGDPAELELIKIESPSAPGVDFLAIFEDLGALERIEEDLWERAQFSDPSDEPESSIEPDYDPYEGRISYE